MRIKIDFNNEIIEFEDEHLRKEEIRSILTHLTGHIYWLGKYINLKDPLTGD